MTFVFSEWNRSGDEEEKLIIEKEMFWIINTIDNEGGKSVDLLRDDSREKIARGPNLNWCERKKMTKQFFPLAVSVDDLDCGEHNHHLKRFRYWIILWMKIIWNWNDHDCCRAEVRAFRNRYDSAFFLFQMKRISVDMTFSTKRIIIPHYNFFSFMIHANSCYRLFCYYRVNAIWKKKLLSRLVRGIPSFEKGQN